MAPKASHIMAALASIACICLSPVLSAAAEETVNADAAAEQTGWLREDGRIIYRFEDGTEATGETEIDGIYYLFSYSGALKTDWQTVDGKRCYYDPATGEALFGWVDYFGSLYYVSPELGKLTGEQEIEGFTYTFDEDGALQETILTEFPSEAATEETAVQSGTAETAVPETTEVPVPETTEAPVPETTAPAVSVGSVITAIGEAMPFVPETFVLPLETVSTEAVTEAAEVIIGEPVQGEPAAEAAVSPLETLPAETEIPQQQTDAAFPVLETIQEIIAETAPALEIPSALPAADFDTALTATRSAFELTVPDYLQKDPAWVDASLGGETIGKYGCLVTAMAMLHSYTAGTCTPVDMAALLSFTSDGSLRRWDDITALGYTVESYSTPVTTEILGAIYQHLCDGKPVVLGSVGSWQHYVVVTGYLGDGTELTAADFSIHDPGYPNRTTLADHLASFGQLYKLIYAS